MDYADYDYFLSFGIDVELVERALKPSEDFELVKGYCRGGGTVTLLNLMFHGVSNAGLGAVCVEMLKGYHKELGRVCNA